jgi:hypothetical protein
VIIDMYKLNQISLKSKVHNDKYISNGVQVNVRADKDGQKTEMKNMMKVTKKKNDEFETTIEVDTDSSRCLAILTIMWNGRLIEVRQSDNKINVFANGAKSDVETKQGVLYKSERMGDTLYGEVTLKLESE